MASRPISDMQIGLGIGIALGIGIGMLIIIIIGEGRLNVKQQINKTVSAICAFVLPNKNNITTTHMNSVLITLSSDQKERSKSC
jgi:hypothetical protein